MATDVSHFLRGVGGVMAQGACVLGHRGCSVLGYRGIVS